MSQTRLHLAMIGATVALFIASLVVNETVFSGLELTRGVNWIYLPAGVRLLCTLLFGGAGAIGLLIASWAVNFFYFFPNDPVRSIAGGILASAAPYLVYLGAQRWYGLHAGLSNLGPARLLYCALAFALASPLLHHLWFALYEHKQHLVETFFAMSLGDFGGTILVLYFAKLLLSRSAPRRP